MHNWHLTLLLILTVLQPIFSEHNFINGGRCCIHSSRLSLTEERLSTHEPYPFAKLPPEKPSLNDQSEIHRKSYRNEDKKFTLPPARFTGDKRIERQTLIPETSQSVRGKILYRSVGDGSPNDHRLTVRSQYYKNFIIQNGHTTETPMIIRLTSKGRKREYEEHFGVEFNSYPVSRSTQKGKNGVQNINKQVPKKTENSEVVGVNDIINRTVKHVRTLKNNENDAYLFERNRRKRDLIRVSENKKNRIADGSVGDGQLRANSYIRDEHNDVKPIKDRHIIRSKHSSFKPLNRDLQQITNTNRNTRSNINIKRHAGGNINERVTFATREVREPSFTRSSQEQKFRIKGKKFDKRNYESYTMRNIYDWTSSLGSDIRQEVTERIMNRQISEYHKEKNSIVKNKHTSVRYYERQLKRERTSSLERGTRLENTRFTDREMTPNHEKRNTSVRNEPIDIRNYDRYSRDSTRDAILSLERGTRQENTRFTDREITPNHEERNTNVRNKPTDIRNYDSYSRDTFTDRTLTLERETRHKNTRFTDREMIPNHVEQNTNVRKPIDIRNYERYSGGSTSDTMLSLERGTRQENTRRITNKKITSNHEERYANVKNKPTDTKDFERYSRDTARDKTSSLDRETRHKNTRVTDREMITNREKRNTNVRNNLNDMKNFERYSKDNTRDRILSLDRDISQGKIRKITDKQTARSYGERKTNVRNDPTDIKDYERYSRDNTRDRTSALDRKISQENVRKIAIREMVRNPIEENQEKYSRENTRDKTLTSERDINKQNSRKNTDTQMYSNHVKQNTNVRSGSTKIKNAERYSIDNTRHRTSFLENGISQENARGITSRQIGRNREKRNTNIRNEPADIRNYERYSRDSTSDTTFSIEGYTRQENMRRITVREITPNREERTTNVRNQPTDIRNYERFSRDATSDKTSSLERDMTLNRDKRNKNVRNKPNVIKDFERYSRDNTRERILSLERGISQEKVKQITDKETASSNGERKTNVRKESSDIKDNERYSTDNTRDRTSALERRLSQENDRKLAIREMARNRIEQDHEKDSRVNPRDNTSMSERGLIKENSRKNTDRQIDFNHEKQNTNVIKFTEIKKYERYSIYNTRRRTSSLEHNIRQENTRRIMDTQMTRNREKRNINVINEHTDIKNSEKYPRDSTIDTASLEGGTRQENTRRIINREMTRYRKERNTNVRKEPTDVKNFERFSRDKTRDRISLLERGINQEIIRKITVGQTARSYKERKINVRNDTTDIRANEYSKDNSRHTIPAIERGISQGNYRKNVDKEKVRTRRELNTNVRNKLTDFRNYERYLRDSTNHIMSFLERRTHQENTKRITEREVTHSHGERNTNRRNEPTDIRKYENYIRDKTRENISDRYINKQDVPFSEILSLLNHEIRHTNIRQEPTIIKNGGKYLTDNSNRKTMAFQHVVHRRDAKRSLDIYSANYRVERQTQERDGPINFRDNGMFSRNNNILKTLSAAGGPRARKRLIDQNGNVRKAPERDNLTIDSYDQRYLRNSNPERDISSRHDTRHINVKSVTDSQKGRNRELSSSFARNQHTENRYYKKSKNNIRELLTRDARHKEGRLLKVRLVARNRVNARNMNIRDDRTDVRKTENHLRNSFRDSIVFDVYDIRPLYVRRMTNNNITSRRNERNTNVHTNIRNEGRLQENIHQVAISSERIIGPSVRNVRLVPSLQQLETTVMKKHYDVRNTEKYSRDGRKNQNVRIIGNRPFAPSSNMKQITIVKQEPNNLTYLRYNTRVTEFSIERKIRQRSAKNDGIERYNSKNFDHPRKYDANGSRHIPFTNRKNERLITNVVDTRKIERYFRNTVRERVSFAERIPDKVYGPHTEFTNTLSSTITKPLVSMTETSKNESSTFYWQYLFYALQGIYIISIFMKENAKISSMDWLKTFRLLKVD